MIGPVDACTVGGIKCTSSISEGSHEHWKCDLIVPHGGQPISSEFHGRRESERRSEMDSIPEDRHDEGSRSEDFSPIVSDTPGK